MGKDNAERALARAWQGLLTRALLLGFVFYGVGVGAQPAPGYYDSANASSSTALRSSLHNIIDDHTWYPYSSSAIDTWDILEIADENQDKSGDIIALYRNASYAKQGGGNSFYNREHTWPKSYGFPDLTTNNYPYTDTHHLFLSDIGYNGSRGNKPFKNCQSGCAEFVTNVNNGRGGAGDSSWSDVSAEGWEVWSERRGDVARALMYMDVRYAGGVHGVTGAPEPDLVLTNNLALIDMSATGNNESLAYMGLLSVLLQWHQEDPVDLIELQHTEAVYQFQGNRNPFVDHPEWVACIFQNQCDGAGGGGGGGGGAAGDAWINEFHYDNGGSDVNEFVEIAGPAGLDLSGWSVVAYNGSNGNSYATVNLSGVIVEASGCMGVTSMNFTGLQNGAPDALALVDDGGTVVHFISYEGTLTANNGPAAGQTAVNIGVAESSSTGSNQSLQLGGQGGAAADFSWQAPQNNTRGQSNNGQTFNACSGDTTAPAKPSGLGATGLDAQVMVDWNTGSDSDLAGYNIYRSLTSGGPYTKINASLSAVNQITDSNVSNGATYFYVVTAVDTSGNESANSLEVSVMPSAPVGGDLWINEFHYDNGGSDVGEFIEIAGPAGMNVSGWKLVSYNGNGGGQYKTITLSGVIPNQQNGRGVLAYTFSGLQNGSSDGIALVDDAGAVVEFLSYEGTLTASNGPAAGMTSTNVVVKESSSTPVGYSLQRAGNGSTASQFVWSQPGPDTPGLINNGQGF